MLPNTPEESFHLIKIFNNIERQFILPLIWQVFIPRGWLGIDWSLRASFFARSIFIKGTRMSRNLPPCVWHRCLPVVELGESIRCAFPLVWQECCVCLSETVTNSNHFHSKIMNFSSQTAFFFMCQMLHFINTTIWTKMNMNLFAVTRREELYYYLHSYDKNEFLLNLFWERQDTYITITG